jgi:uncharacterized membrane protein
MTWLERVFALTCDQLPDRSPQFSGVVFPLCFRLAGLYLGVAAAYLVIAASRGWREPLTVRRGTALAVLLLPLLIDGWGNTLHFWNTPGPLRALTGLTAGIALPMLLMSIDAPRTPQSGHPVRRVLWAVGAGLLLVAELLRPSSVLVFDGLAVVAAAGFVMLVANLLWAARPAAWSRTLVERGRAP